MLQFNIFWICFDDGTARDATKAETITAWNRRADKPETDFISRKAIYDAVNDIGGCDATDECAKGYDAAIDAAIDVLQNIPAADVAPVRHGYWIYQSSRKYINTDINEEKLQKETLGYGGRVILNLQCSVCRKVTMVCNSISYEYCPHCGAKMDGDTNGS